MEYEKLIDNEPIKIGDLIELDPITNKVTRAVNKWRQTIKVIGVCIKIENNRIVVANKGIVDVNVTRIILYRR